MTNAILDQDSDRLQVWENGYLWHRSQPQCCVWGGDGATGEFLQVVADPTGQISLVPTGTYFLRANLFTGDAPEYGDGFWLVPDDDGAYDAGNYADSDPGVDGAVYVPWAHVVQHLYSHLSSFEIKEAHTFWPAGTTEAQVLAELVAALNNDGASPNTTAVVGWSGPVLKTFFLRQPVDPGDRYTPAQLSDLKDLLG